MMKLWGRGGVALAGAIALYSGSSLAQTAAPAPAAPAKPAETGIAWGPPVAGLCFVSRAQVMGDSAAGAAATRRLRALEQSAKGELATEERAIRSQQKALQAQAPSLAPQVLQQKGEALARRGQALQQSAQAKSARLSETQKLAEKRIGDEIERILPALVGAHHCGVVFERGVTYGSNPGMDLTAEVIAQLNSRLPSFTFDLAPAPGAR